MDKSDVAHIFKRGFDLHADRDRRQLNVDDVSGHFGALLQPDHRDDVGNHVGECRMRGPDRRVATPLRRTPLTRGRVYPTHRRSGKGPIPDLGMSRLPFSTRWRVELRRCEPPSARGPLWLDSVLVGFGAHIRTHTARNPRRRKASSGRRGRDAEG